MRAVVQDLLPVTEFHEFHPDPNIDFQLNRFLVSGLEQQFADIGAKIKDFDDWKSLFLAAATAHEESGTLGPASRLYRAAEFFMSPDDPDRRRAADKFIGLFCSLNDSEDSGRIKMPYGTGHLHRLRLRSSARLCPDAQAKGPTPSLGKRIGKAGPLHCAVPHAEPTK